MQQHRTFWLLLTMMLVGGFTLTSCVDNKDDANEGGSGDNYKNYVERMYPVVDPQNSPQGMVMLRFYDDMPSVAYVSISNFQSIMYPGTTVQVVKTAEHQYALASPCGTAKVDTDKDLFMSNDYEAFTNMMDMVQPGMPNTIYDALPIIRWKSLDASPKQVDVTLDYGKYGIDIREDGENVYFPFATIADLYTDSYMHMADFAYRNLCLQGGEADNEHRRAHEHLQLLMWQPAARTPERLRHLPARQEVGRRILRGALQPLSRWLRLYLLHASYSPQQLERREHRRRYRARLPVGSRRIL